MKLAFAVALLAPSVAHAYRPFDGTDADVAELDTIELEIGPLQGERGNGSSTYEPGFVFNEGISAGFELVCDIDSSLGHGSLVVSDVLVKHVIHEGSLQEGSGPSVAMETGVLLPGVPVRGHDEAGWSFAMIASQKWSVLTIHLNGFVAYERDRSTTANASVIFEGPAAWRVRPVSELLVEDNEHGALASALGGAIWQYKKDLAFDGAIRVQRAQEITSVEVRIGLTWAFAI